MLVALPEPMQTRAFNLINNGINGNNRINCGDMVEHVAGLEGKFERGTIQFEIEESGLVTKVQGAKPGDILLMKFDGLPQHLALVVIPGLFFSKLGKDGPYSIDSLSVLETYYLCDQEVYLRLK